MTRKIEKLTREITDLTAVLTLFQNALLNLKDEDKGIEVLNNLMDSKGLLVQLKNEKQFFLQERVQIKNSDIILFKFL